MTSSSRLPETYHITTLSPFMICLPRNSKSWSAVRRICASGVCQRITSGTKLSISVGLARSLLQRIDAARQRVAGGIVAADDQQDQVAEEIVRVHVARGFAVNHHRQ